MVRVLKGISILLGVVGALALADGVTTLVWQEPISSLMAHFAQTRLAQSLRRLEAERATPAEVRALAALPTDNQRMAFFARKLRATARDGQAVGRIVIPRIGANFVIVAGTDEASLQKGPGIYSGTAVPGLRGTVGIAGHRTTYLAPFRRINELAPGDRVTLEMPYGRFSYTVLGHKIVSPTDVAVLRPATYDQVVLTACNPLYSAAQRIIVFARLTADAPAGQALAALPTAAKEAPALLPQTQAEDAVLGGAAASPLGPGALPPGIDAAAVIVGAVRGTPSPSAAGQPAAGPALPSKQPAPSPGPSTPPSSSVRAPVLPAPPAPVRVAPRAPVRATAPTPAPVRPQPAVRPPPAPKASPPAAPAPSAGGQAPQTRVYGGPGGPAPIIAAPSN